MRDGGDTDAACPLGASKGHQYGRRLVGSSNISDVFALKLSTVKRFASPINPKRHSVPQAMSVSATTSCTTRLVGRPLTDKV